MKCQMCDKAGSIIELTKLEYQCNLISNFQFKYGVKGNSQFQICSRPIITSISMSNTTTVKTYANEGPSFPFAEKENA